MPETENKIYCGFRLSRKVLSELESLSRSAGMDKTEIVELAVLHVRPVIKRMLAARLRLLRQ